MYRSIWRKFLVAQCNRVGLDAGRGEGGGGLADINLTREFCCQRYFQLPFEVKTLAITLFNIYAVNWSPISYTHVG